MRPYNAYSMVQLLPARLRAFALQRNVRWMLIVVNLLGTAFGFYYYADQLAQLPPVLWVFVADSPIATFLLAVSLVLYGRDRQSPVIDTLAFIANGKYGAWSVFVLLYYADTFYGGNPLSMYLFLLFSHTGMVLQAFLVLDYARFTPITLSLGGTWFVLNDFLDYQFDLHTRLYADHGHPFSPAFYAAMTLTITIWLLAFWHYRSTVSEQQRIV